MKTFVVFCLLVLWTLMGCAPAPSSELDSEIQKIREQISTLESREAVEIEEMMKKKESLATTLENLTKEREVLQDTLSRLEIEVAEYSSAQASTEASLQSAVAEGLDQIMLLNGNTLSAEIKEISGDQITILLDGKEQTGKLSTIRSIRFRSGNNPDGATPHP